MPLGADRDLADALEAPAAERHRHAVDAYVLVAGGREDRDAVREAVVDRVGEEQVVVDRRTGRPGRRSPRSTCSRRRCAGRSRRRRGRRGSRSRARRGRPRAPCRSRSARPGRRRSRRSRSARRRCGSRPRCRGPRSRRRGSRAGPSRSMTPRPKSAFRSSQGMKLPPSDGSTTPRSSRWFGVDAGVEHRDRDRAVAGRAAPGGLDVHPVVVPLEERRATGSSPGRRGRREAGTVAVPAVRAAQGGAAGRSAPMSACREEVGDGAARGEPRVEDCERGTTRERVDRAQVADDDPAGRGDGRAHLRRRRAWREPDDGDAEGIAGGGGGARECERAEERSQGEGWAASPWCKFGSRRGKSSITLFGKAKGRPEAALRLARSCHVGLRAASATRRRGRAWRRRACARPGTIVSPATSTIGRPRPAATSGQRRLPLGQHHHAEVGRRVEIAGRVVADEVRRPAGRRGCSVRFVHVAVAAAGLYVTSNTWPGVRRRVDVVAGVRDPGVVRVRRVDVDRR